MKKINIIYVMYTIVITVLCISNQSFSGCNDPNTLQPVTMTITSPSSDNQKVVLSELNTPLLTLTAQTSGDAYRIKWSAAFNFVDNITSGTSVQIMLTSWPTYAVSYGLRGIYIQYDGGIGDTCTAARFIKFYFDPDAMINEEPAWFVIWKSGVVPDLDRFEYVDEIDGDEDGDVFGDCGGIFNQTYTEVSCTLRITAIAPTYWLDSGAYKVDSVEYVVGHELGHEDAYKQYAAQREAVYSEFINTILQNPYQEGSSAYDTYVANAFTVRDADFLAIDMDEDFVPDDIDPDLGLEYMGVTDHEAYANYYAMIRPYAVIAEHEWSEGGKNDI